MSEFAQTERHPVFPVFLLVDVSTSMSGAPIQALNDALPGLQKAIRDDPTVGEIARIGVITFSDRARTVLPLSDLFYAEVPLLSCEGATNFAEAFRVARRVRPATVDDAALIADLSLVVQRLHHEAHPGRFTGPSAPLVRGDASAVARRQRGASLHRRAR